MSPGRRRVAPLLMAHVVPGLEDLAWEELLERTGDTRRVATWSGIDRRAGVLLFRSSQPAHSLLDLRLSEDIFAVVASTRGLPPGKAALGAIKRLVRAGDGLDHALRCQREVSAARRRTRPAYRVVVRRAGRHAFRRVDAQRACEQGLASLFPRWRLVEDQAALEFWLQIIGDAAVLALRLSSEAMRQRTYRGVSLPAALKPTVAAALVRLARPGAGPLLDPMCGTGTLLAEATGARVSALGGDIESRAVRAAQRNLASVGAPGAVARWDATRLPLRDGAVAGVACNLPWGRRHHAGDLTHLYRRFMDEAQRVVRGGDRIALLTSERGIIERLLRGRRDLAIERRLRVIVRGTDAWMMALQKLD